MTLRRFTRRRLPPPPPPGPDPLSPWTEHEALRGEADARAAEDARRHADDLLDRRLPFADHATALVATRLERLAAARAERLAPRERVAAAAERTLSEADEALGASAAVLEALGVPRDQHAAVLERDRWWRAAWRAHKAKAGDDAAIVERAWRRLATARARAVEAGGVYVEAQASVRAVTSLADTVAAAEAALARELVERYRASLVRHLPPQSLADGATVADQALDVPAPGWPTPA